jgi:TadE-like protein
MKRTTPLLRRFFRASAGASAVEMAFVILLFVFIVYAIFQFAMAMWMWNTLMLAAEEGGRQAMIHNAVYDPKTNQGCDTLWNKFVQPIVAYNLPGNWSDYGPPVKYACQPGTATTPPTMTIAITYAWLPGGSFGAGMNIPGFTLAGQYTAPLD